MDNETNPNIKLQMVFVIRFSESIMQTHMFDIEFICN